MSSIGLKGTLCCLGGKAQPLRCRIKLRQLSYAESSVFERTCYAGTMKESFRTISIHKRIWSVDRPVEGWMLTDAEVQAGDGRHLPTAPTTQQLVQPGGWTSQERFN